MKTPARLRLAAEGAHGAPGKTPCGVQGSPACGRTLEAALRQRGGTCCARCGSSPSASHGDGPAWLTPLVAAVSGPISSCPRPCEESLRGGRRAHPGRGEFRWVRAGPSSSAGRCDGFWRCRLWQASRRTSALKATQRSCSHQAGRGAPQHCTERPITSRTRATFWAMSPKRTPH
jgi:hypothetical protein